jgi:hypothetical protein
MNFHACSASGKMWTFLHVQSMLIIRGTNFIAHWAYGELISSHVACWAFWEPISSHAEHAQKCLKVEYLGPIEYYFQKSRVTGPWDHKDSVSAKKVKKKISCLCTFNLHLLTDISLVSAWQIKKNNLIFLRYTLFQIVTHSFSADNSLSLNRYPIQFRSLTYYLSDVNTFSSQR